MTDNIFDVPSLSRRAFGLGALGGAALFAGSRPLPASATPLTTHRLTTVGPEKPVDRDGLGVNGARIISAENARQWHDPAFADALAAVGPGLLRVQGGTTSQWLDWRTGLFTEGDGGGFAGRNDGRPPILLGDWAELARKTGATPIFDLNVLNSTVDDQLDMLRAAQRLGMPVRYVELGNELWVPMSPYSSAFPTGADYGRAVNDWIAAIRQEFPQARIAVAAAVAGPSMSLLGPRYADWNAGLYATVRDADAVVFHPYWIVDPIAADLSSTAAGGVAAWNDLAQHSIADVPAELDVWITEYNQMGKEATAPLDRLPAPPQTWAVGLSVAAFTLRALAEPRLRLAVLHCALNGVPADDTGGGGTTNQALHALISDGSGGSELFGRTALNWALTPVYHAVSDGCRVRPLRLDPAPRIPAALIVPAEAGLVDAFTGVELSTADGTGAILVNTSDRSLRVDLPSHLAGSATVYTAAPTVTPAFVVGDTVTETRTTVSGTIDLPPYSETVLGTP
ncbi:hypothetical protein [Nocardia stercoris]|uniref:Uncharacterized protein n=1 Tax=Nocardia stercoris TaxID=2483361 RepID=A0A3M2L9K7_9NOCA|nr:hypothetical protein [Nocardia stercoris]RMI34272.1 hypothetical protein EBN03_07690 [Nocardia stercoris]